MPSGRIVLWIATFSVSAFALGAALMTKAQGVQRVSNDALQENQYLAESDIAMRQMMRSMVNAPAGDVDRDFVAQMVPHHQGAIDMAEALLRTGHNERLRRLAQEIIVTQRDEIAVMRLAVAKP